MSGTHTRPADIERTSMAIIAEELKTLPEKTAEITQKWLSNIKNNAGRDFRF